MKKKHDQVFTVDQLLHGYDGGHKLLAHSRNLGSSERHTVLQLSDRAADTKDMSAGGYLTGYPLPGENLYVLSRTWPAPEMSRPGCVWTHSLLISYTDLARLDQPYCLLHMFRRPENRETLSGYGEPQSAFCDQSFFVSDLDFDLARSLLIRLYAYPDHPVTLPAEPFSTLESTTLAIWGQQWPRLKRNFRFCTLTARDRSTSEHPFDLQFYSKEATRSATWTDVFQDQDLDYSNEMQWVSTALRDLKDSSFALRSFLRRVGGDINGGRDRFAELCTLFWHTHNDTNVESIERVLDYVSNRLPQSEGKLLRDQAFASAAHRAVDLSDESLLTILPYLTGTLDDMPNDRRQLLAKRYWNIDPIIFFNEQTPTELRAMLPELTAELSLTDIEEAIFHQSSMAETIVRIRPEILAQPSLWRRNDTFGRHLLTEIELSSGLSESVVEALIRADRADLAAEAVAQFGGECVTRTAIAFGHTHPHTALYFVKIGLERAINRSSLIADVLSSSDTRLDKRIIYALTQSVSAREPSTQANFPNDPWARAWTESTGDIDAYQRDAVLVFLFERASLVGGASSASILSVSFDELYERFAAGSISYSLRSRISHHLAPSDWFDWSLANRLIRTVARMAVEYSYSEADLLALTNESYRLRQLLRTIDNSAYGRSYLKKTASKAGSASQLRHLI